jgi:hypothetical protein
MNAIKRFGLFWYHFIVGDDWRIAAGVIAGLALTAFLTHSSHLNTWWLLPALVVTMLSLSLWAATRKG